jgi:TonB-linked SusC/RagA family outer membrane protein
VEFYLTQTLLTTKSMIKRLTLLLGFLVVCMGAFAQSRTITGKVTDANGEPLPGATVLWKSTKIGTVTDLNGAYQIKVEGNDAVLQVSYVGYTQKEISVGSASTADVVLEEDMTTLTEVVVVGYGTQKKSLVTGSISKVDAEQLTLNKPSTVNQALQGKTAGVVVQQTSGAPGGGFTVRVRGVGSNAGTDPLYIVDGVRTGGIDYLSPTDIESIEVLKDAASAAIYGAEGANGVVLITTKSGKNLAKGDGEITYSYYRGVQSAVNLPKVLNAHDYVSYLREALATEYTAGGTYGKATPEANLQKKINGIVPFSPDTIGNGTNWADEVFKTAPVEEHNLQFSGNSEKGWYNISTSIFNQDGIVGGSKSNFKRYTFRVNADQNVKEWFKVGTRVGYTHKQKNSLSENNEFGGVVADVLQLDPLTPVFFNDTNELKQVVKSAANRALALKDDQGRYYGISRMVANEVRNPLAQINNTHDKYTEDKLVGSAFAEFTPIKDLTIRSQVGFDMAYGTNESWTPTSYYNLSTITPMSSMYQGDNRWTKISFENYATYTKTFGKHNVSGMIGISNEDYSHSFMGGTRYKMLLENDDFNILSSALIDSTQVANGNKDHSRLASTFGRLSYNYDEKYMIQGQLRQDGSSRLGKGNKFHSFPSVSLGWVVSREAFWNVPFINMLKARASWGQNGSISSLRGNFGYVSLIGYGAGYADGTGSVLNGALPDGLSNPDYVWETSQQTDFGIDLGMLDNRITFTADYFDKRTIDQLVQDATVADYVGNTAPMVNSGEVSNKGVEFEISYRETKGEFKYNVSFNGSYLKNNVESFGKDQSITDVNFGTAGACKKYEQGQPAWYLYGYKTDGIFQNATQIANYKNEKGELLQPNAIPGDIIFKDVAGIDASGKRVMIPDGKIDETDKTNIGNPFPEMTMGLSVGCDYKGFDFNMFWQAVTGNDIINATYRADLKNINKPEYFYSERWTGEGSTNTAPRASYQDKNSNFRISDFFVEDGSYLRLKNVTLGYTLPNSLTSKVLIKKLRIYVSGQNLLTFTKYRGMDPEVGGTTGASGIGVDKGLYPQSKVIMGGVSITF